MVGMVGAAVFGRFASWVMRQIVTPDPWEPAIGERQWLISERDIGQVVPDGRPLAVCNSAAEVVEFVARHGVERFFLTHRRQGQCETVDERDAWRLLGVAMYRFREPELSPEEVQRVLMKQEASAA